MSTLKTELQALGLPNEAIAWLISIYDIIQAFDDIKDEGKLDDTPLYDLIFKSMVAMPTNAFYLNNMAGLATLVNLLILKWIASNNLEQNGKANAQSYMWRASYFDIVLHVVFLCKGFDFAKNNAHIILSLYSETLEDYLQEFELCQTLEQQ